MDILSIRNLKNSLQIILAGTLFLGSVIQATESTKEIMLENIKSNRNDREILARLLPIVKCSFAPTQYEQILMTGLRDKETQTKQFRELTNKLAGLLISKVVEALSIETFEIDTPLTKCKGYALDAPIEFVSVMRAGDSILETFMEHFPEASVTKILVQRDEETAEPHFKYMKFSPAITEKSRVIITEPMIATGGTLCMVIDLLKQKGVKEENITIASVCTAPEGLLVLCKKFPKISVVMNMMDDYLNEQKYIVPGLGDFGDRYYGTNQ